MEKVRLHIRWIIRRDMPEVLDIERRSFRRSAWSRSPAWSEEDFLRVLRNRNCIGMVAEHGEAVVGYMIYELHKSRLEVLNFAVHPEWRRIGIGSQMVAKLVSKLSNHRRTHITLKVAESNLPAQVFFRSQGFRAISVVSGYFTETGGEDAFAMVYELGN